MIPQCGFSINPEVFNLNNMLIIIVEYHFKACSSDSLGILHYPSYIAQWIHAYLLSFSQLFLQPIFPSFLALSLTYNFFGLGL